jgi:hypothetical protein
MILDSAEDSYTRVSLETTDHDQGLGRCREGKFGRSPQDGYMTKAGRAFAAV